MGDILFRNVRKQHKKTQVWMVFQMLKRTNWADFGYAGFTVLYIKTQNQNVAFCWLDVAMLAVSEQSWLKLLTLEQSI